MEVSFSLQSNFLYNNAHIIMLHTSLSEQSRKNNLATSNVDTSTTVLNVDKHWTDSPTMCFYLTVFVFFQLLVYCSFGSFHVY